MTTLFATKAQAIATAARRKDARKPAPHFTVNVTFGDADDPQVIAENVKGATGAINAARVWAMGAIRRGEASVQDFENVFGIRSIDEPKKPSEEERMLRSMLNGGGLTLKVGDVTFFGTFDGYSIPH